jgi:pyruvate/2-oxoglutarate dehydrogenase complex dihydrolipoamide acyltransferase (E2) component
VDEKIRGYQTYPFPANRRLVIDAGWMGSRKRMMHGFIEVEVSESRRLIRAYKERTGESLSFTAFLVSCVGRAVAEDRRVQAYRNWRNQLVLFDDVDVLLAIEIPSGDRTFPLVHPVREANRRPILDIHREIRAIQADPSASETRQNRWIGLFVRLPAVLRHLLYRVVELHPPWRKAYGGTVLLTSVGMFGRGGGWGLALHSHTLSVTVGGISTRPAFVHDQMAPREYLHVTLSFDHDLVDGAPAARFSRTFSELVESAQGLEEALARG